MLVRAVGGRDEQRECGEQSRKGVGQPSRDVAHLPYELAIVVSHRCHDGSLSSDGRGKVIPAKGVADALSRLAHDIAPPLGGAEGSRKRVRLQEREAEGESQQDEPCDLNRVAGVGVLCDSGGHREGDQQRAEKTCASLFEAASLTALFLLLGE